MKEYWILDFEASLWSTLRQSWLQHFVESGVHGQQGSFWFLNLQSLYGVPSAYCRLQAMGISISDSQWLDLGMISYEI